MSLDLPRPPLGPFESAAVSEIPSNPPDLEERCRRSTDSVRSCFGARQVISQPRAGRKCVVHLRTRPVCGGNRPVPSRLSLRTMKDYGG